MKIKSLLTNLSLIGLIAYAMSPALVQAAGQLTNRSATVTDSAGGATNVGYAVKFTFGTGGQTVGAIKVELCDSPISTNACVNSGNSSGASFNATDTGTVTVNSGTWGNSGTCALDNPNTTGNTAILTCTVGTITGTPTVTVNLNKVVNPSANNKEYYLRVSTYDNNAASSPAYPGTDYGAMALGTSQQIVVSGTMPESLVFCVGATVSSDCTTIGAGTVSLGTFSPTSTNTGTSQMAASTNAGSGYAITINGTTLTSGLNSIAAMGTQSANSAGCAPSCTSTTGVSQFGTNVRDNTTPNVGADVTPTGAGYGGAGVGGYNTVDSFRFFTGDTVASSAGVSNAQTFTNSYIVNVGGAQAAGLYSATMTYICTATF